MATKPRHLKTPLQLWIADNRKEKGLTPGDLARLTGVTEDTARGWESRGSPSEDAIAILERTFGKPAPRDAGAGAPGGDVAAAIDRQTAVLAQLAETSRQQATLMAALLAHLTASEPVDPAIGDRAAAFLSSLGAPQPLPTAPATPRGRP